MTEPAQKPPRKTSAIAITLLASGITAVVGCGGSFMLDGNHAQSAAVVMAVLGLVAIGVFVLTAIFGVIYAIVMRFKHD
jgi:hypothetical protein